MNHYILYTLIPLLGLAIGHQLSTLNTTKGAFYSTSSNVQLTKGVLLLNYTLLPPVELLSTLCKTGLKLEHIYVTIEEIKGDSSLILAISHTLHHFIDTFQLPWLESAPNYCKTSKYKFDINNLHSVLQSSSFGPGNPSTSGNHTTHMLSKRRRRGLINLGGSALKLVFGTATESDLQDLSKNIDNKFKTLRQITSKVLFSALKINKRLNTLDGVLHELSKLALRNNHNYKLLEVLNMINKIDLFLSETSIHSAIVNTMMSLITLNSIHHDLLPMSAFKHLVSEVSSHFRLQPIMVINKTTYSDYLNFCSISRGQGRYNLLINIPFSDGSYISSYTIHPFPTIVAGKKRFLLKEPKSLLLVDKNSYLVYESPEICVTHTSTMLCPSIEPIWSSPNDQCLSQLIMGLQPTLCTFEKIEPTTIYYTNFQGFWLISLLNTTLARISCHEQKDIPQYRSLNGIVIIPPGCSFSTDTLSLYSPLATSQSLVGPTNNPVFLPHIDMSNRTNYLFSKEDTLVENLKQTMIQLNKKGTNDSLASILVSLRDTTVSAEKRSIITYTLFFIIFIFMGFTLYAWCKSSFKHKLSKLTTFCRPEPSLTVNSTNN